MAKLNFILALVAIFIFSGCLGATLVARVPISALVSRTDTDVKSEIRVLDIAPKTHDEAAIAKTVRIFAADAKFKESWAWQSIYDTSVRAGSGETGDKNASVRAVRIYLDFDGGIYARLSKNALERYADAKKGAIPELSAIIKFENDTNDVYELVSSNDFKPSDEAETGGVYILEPGQATGAFLTESAAVREALLGRAVKIARLRKVKK